MSSPAEDHAIERIKLELTIDALRDEVTYYRERLTDRQIDNAAIVDPLALVLQRDFKLTVSEVRLTLALYHAAPDTVERAWLEATIPGEEVEARAAHVAVVASRVRTKLGDSTAVQNVWGKGYYMSETVQLILANHLANCDSK